MICNEHTGTPCSRIDVALSLLIMVLLFPFGEEAAREAVSDRLASGFNDGNKLEPEWFEQLKHDVKAYRAKIVTRFEAFPRNQEEVDAIMYFVEIRLDDCIQHLAGTDPLGLTFKRRDVAVAILDCEAAIDELQRTFEVSDTEPLEAVRDKLQAWLDEFDRQHVPHPSFPKGPV